ncbi:MAG TPA: FAD-dependent oxidoreductase [Candidatus Saccharimonadales bacterium]|nr:FAD-dependent oxidoreductase [Candidatus Saccharimonadales bacterium]
MDLVKLEIDGKRVIAENRQTILQVARANGIQTIPTLCHDNELEPFASCFLCVVKVQGARTLLPACSTKVSAGMVVETNTPEVRRSRKAALELMLSNHYADCIGPCQLQCPAGVDIQGYIALAALGKYEDAIQLIKRSNPLPAICGRVCTRPCEVKGCRRTLLDEAVGIDYIKRYLADLSLARREAPRPPRVASNGKRVAVVGAGPAGLSCAYYLALKGYGVRLFESLPEAGGMLRYGIPEYRLPKDVLDLEVNQILDLGVTLSTNVALGRDFTVSSLRQEGYDAVFLGLGAWESSKMRVQNEDAPGVLAGIEFLRQFGLHRSPDLHGKVLVVGGGNTAIDCARTALRLNAGEVRLLYRRTRAEMPANEMEIVEAEHEGVHLDLLVAPVRVIAHEGRVTALECIRMELGEPDSSGRRSPRPIRGSEFVVDCDFVIAAIGQNTRLQELVDGRVPGFLPFGEVLNLTRWQTIQVNDRTFETSVEGVFAGGDVVTGAATAIEAIAAGRRAAHAIHTYVTTGKAQPEPVEFCSRKDAYRKITVDDLRDGSRHPRRAMPVLPPEERRKSFAEVEQGYSAEDLRNETRRCLECGCVSLFDCDLRRYATEYQVDVTSFMGEAKEYRVDRSHPLIELDPNKCVLCGRCVRMCAEVVGVAAYGFINRGFDTVVRPTLGGSLLDTECVSCGLCIGTCPTGAIVERIPLAKPGPWKTSATPTVCAYCSVGCRLSHDTFGDTLVKMSRREEPLATHGYHCRKGRFGYAHVQSRERLRQGRIRAGRELQDAPLEETLRYAALRLKELRRRYSGREMLVLVSPRMTNEEIYLAQKFARIALRTHNVTSAAHLVNRELFCPEVQSTASYADLADAQAILVVNANPAEDNFVVDLLAKKALRKGGRLLYVGPEEDRLAHFAEVFLKCRPGTQSQAVLALLAEVARVAPAQLETHAELRRLAQSPEAGRARESCGVEPESLAVAARILAGSILKVMVFSRDFRGRRTPGDSRFLAAAGEALGCSVLALHEKSNMQGLLDLGAHPGWLPGYVPPDDEAAVGELEKEWCVVLRDLEPGAEDPAELLRRKAIRVAVVLGEDPLGSPDFPADLRAGLLAADFLVVGDLFATATAQAASVVLPLSSSAETAGTVTNLERRVQPLVRAIPPLAGSESWQILCGLGAGMGYRFKMKYAGVDEVTAEIRRVVPIYRDVAVGSQDSDGIWDLGRLRLPRVPADPAGLAGSVEPVPTLALDELEARFARWFEAAMAGARASLAGEARGEPVALEVGPAT